MAIERVGVVGCGQMGSGIAEVCARAGYDTLVHEINDEILAKGVDRIRGSLERGVKASKLSREQADEAFGRIHGTTHLEDFADRDLVIEAVTENLDIKRTVHRTLDGVCRPHAILATNTSSLPIIEMAAVTRRPAQFLGIHFFIPAPVMPLVELVQTITTSDETVAQAREFVRTIGKRPILAKDIAGFIVNRLLVPYLLSAIRLHESGLASREDIDEGVKLGLGHPMGPLALSDYVGLDTLMYVADVLYDEFREPHYAPPPLLRRMVQAGYYGRKSGKGFYDYGK
ncbi:MAG: 3-hydroxybutyryl-CoA dehydrogenase [Chloroflexi bacterium]|nr:3-hydroxybutyryl-CoA dehydrogenase [Chloroflexota bacterium]